MCGGGAWVLLLVTGIVLYALYRHPA